MAERDFRPFPEHILQLKSELSERWQQLPIEHQATMVLVLVKEVLAGEYGTWLREALELTVMKPPDEVG